MESQSFLRQYKLYKEKLQKEYIINTSEEISIIPPSFNSIQGII